MGTESQMASLNAAKRQLRSAMKQKLSSISQESVKLQSSAVSNTLKTFRPYVEAKRVSVFLSMPTGEIQTDAIVRHALGSGKEVYIPYLHANPSPSTGFPSRVMDMVRLRDADDYDSLKRDKWGIPSFDPATIDGRQRILGDQDAQAYHDPAVLDLILVPGVAFDVNPETGALRRLGHGKGFYDYFISRHRAKEEFLGRQGPSAFLYALGLSEQLLSSSSQGSVPVGPLDQPLDGLILGDGEVKSPTVELS